MDAATEGVLAILGLLFGLAALHEWLHIWMAHRMGIKTKLSIYWVAKVIPMGIKVEMAGFTGSTYKQLEPAKKWQYDLIALKPYLVMFPLGLFFWLNPMASIVLSTVGVSVLAWHVINLPMEWVAV